MKTNQRSPFNLCDFNAPINMPFEDPATAICLCSFCRNPLRFQPTRAGEIINCLHCGMETLLYTTEVDAPYPKERSVTVQNVKLEVAKFGVRYLVGEVVNDCAGDLDWIRVEMALYNGTSFSVGTASDSNINFHSGKVWRFRAYVPAKDATHAALPVFSCEYGKILFVENFNCDFLSGPNNYKAQRKNNNPTAH